MGLWYRFRLARLAYCKQTFEVWDGITVIHLDNMPDRFSRDG